MSILGTDDFAQWVQEHLKSPRRRQFYFFGCLERMGHFLYDVHGNTVRLEEEATPWGHKLDGTLCPGWRGPYQTPESVQLQGLAALHHKDGWTAVSFWDRTVDSRPGSNAAFVAEAEIDFDRMLEIAAVGFPKVLARMPAPIRLAKPGELR